MYLMNLFLAVAVGISYFNLQGVIICRFNHHFLYHGFPPFIIGHALRNPYHI